MVFWCESAFANPGITLVNCSEDGPLSGIVSLEEMKKHSRNLRVIDLNFKSNGVCNFTGIYLDQLMGISRLSPREGITILGADQYMAYLPREALNTGFLAWAMDGKSLGPLEGGPLKILYTSGSNPHPDCYTWYVDAVVLDRLDNAMLTVTHGRGMDFYRRMDLLDRAKPLDIRFMAIPRGCRHRFEGPLPGDGLLALPLVELIPDDVSVKQIICRSMTGPEFHLSPEILSRVQLVIGYGDTSLHPALGGPFSLYFPLEIPAHLSHLVPDSGGVFYLTEIGVK